MSDSGDGMIRFHAAGNPPGNLAVYDEIVRIKKSADKSSKKDLMRSAAEDVTGLPAYRLKESELAVINTMKKAEIVAARMIIATVKISPSAWKSIIGRVVGEGVLEIIAKYRGIEL